MTTDELENIWYNELPTVLLRGTVGVEKFINSYEKKEQIPLLRRIEVKIKSQAIEDIAFSLGWHSDSPISFNTQAEKQDRIRHIAQVLQELIHLIPIWIFERQQPKESQKKISTSYCFIEWKGNLEQRNYLFKQLKKEGFLNSQDEELFHQHFDNKEPFKKLKWRKSEYAVLRDLLFDLPTISYNQKPKYQVIIDHFLKPDGTEFTSDTLRRLSADNVRHKDFVQKLIKGIISLS